MMWCKYTAGELLFKVRNDDQNESSYHWHFVFLLLLLSRFSRVRLCATPEMAAHQTPPSLGFSRQEHWSGLPFPSPMHESESEVSQSCPTLRNPMDCSLPGSSVHGIFQARVLEWGAIAFSICFPSVHLFLYSTHFLNASHVAGIDTDTRNKMMNQTQPRPLMNSQLCRGEKPVNRYIIMQ